MKEPAIFLEHPLKSIYTTANWLRNTLFPSADPLPPFSPDLLNMSRDEYALRYADTEYKQTNTHTHSLTHAYTHTYVNAYAFMMTTSIKH